MLQIPNDTLRYRKPLQYDFSVKRNSTFGEDSSKAPTPADTQLRGDVSQKTIQEANVLHLRVRYGYKLTVPIVNNLILKGYQAAKAIGSMNGTGMDAFEKAMVSQGKLPLSAEGSEGMQTPLHWHPFYSFGPGNGVSGALGGALNGISVSGNGALTQALEAPGDMVTSVTGFIRGATGATFQAMMASWVDPLGSAVGNANAFCPATWHSAATAILGKVPSSISP